MVLPAPITRHKITWLKIRRARFDHLSDIPADDDLADVHRISVGPHARDPSPHVGIHREVNSLHQRLAGLWLRERRLLQLEIGFLRQPIGPRREPELPDHAG